MARKKSDGTPGKKGTGKVAKKSAASAAKPDPRSKPDPRPSGPAKVTGEDKARSQTGAAASGKAAERGQVDQRKELLLNMQRSVVTEPLLSQVLEDPSRKYDVIIALNELYSAGMRAAHDEVERQAAEWGVRYSQVSGYYFACLSGHQILGLADDARRRTRELGKGGSIVYRIWEDSDVSITLTRSLVTVKADAAQRAFQAFGDGITWAVLDSGVEGTHPHFTSDALSAGKIRSLALTSPLVHLDFTPDGRAQNPDAVDGTAPHPSALVDRLGHGTHVAGIISGYWQSADPAGEPVLGTEVRDETSDKPDLRRETLTRVSGIAPLCKIVSMKVIADVTVTGDARQTAGQGKVSWLLMAIERIQQWNGHGKRLLVHGVNMSLGYDFDPRWFACGQSPLCVEVNRLVRSGVAVVVSAGNGGYPTFIAASGKSEARYVDMSITDPGNAELAITVGSTHRENPHTFGISYFSSRGPTGDGRMKPDIVAPGERIRSCAAGAEAAKYQGATPIGEPDDTEAAGRPVLYCEQSGTSMSAPHVSGAIAAFLSTRTEFVGQPERVKRLLMSNAIDLGRERHFQGAGLLDVMKTMQSV